MLFIVIEHFKEGKTKDIYSRLQVKGRTMPEGLRYIDSWISASLDRCFQLMECDNPALFQEWILEWDDLATFEIIPVVPSNQTKKIINKQLESDRQF